MNFYNYVSVFTFRGIPRCYRSPFLWHQTAGPLIAAEVLFWSESSQEHGRDATCHTLEALSSRRFEISMEVLKTSLGSLISCLMGSR